MNSRLFSILLSLFFGISSQAQIPDSIPKKPFIKKSSLVVLPALFYTPETRFGGGSATIFSFRFRNQTEQIRPSQLQLGLAYTQEKQILSYLPFQVYLKKEDWYLNGELGYYRFVYKFFGIGNETKIEDEEIYQAKFPRLRLNALKRISKPIFLGVRYWFDNYEIFEKEEGKLLDISNVTGRNGGIISGLGLVMNYDTRNHIFFPTEGNFSEIVLFRNDKKLGSDFNFTSFYVDVAQYFPLKENQTLAFNGFLHFHFGDPVFQQLPLLGGPEKLRGIFEGRYRDKRLWVFQTEYRRSIWKFVGGTIFAGMGSVAPDFESLFSSKIHSTFGMGLRLRLSKKDKINMRIDFGWDEHLDFYPYVLVAEAF